MTDKNKGVDALIIVREAYQLAFLVDRVADQMLSDYPTPTVHDWSAADNQIRLLKLALFDGDASPTLDKIALIFDRDGDSNATAAVRQIASQVFELLGLFQEPAGFHAESIGFRAGLYKEIASDIRFAVELVQPWLASDYPVQSLGLLFDDELNCVQRNGYRKPCQLTKTQWLMFRTIYKVNSQHGVACPVSRIADERGDDGASGNTIESSISAMRKELSPLSIDIKIDRGKGYRITHLEQGVKAKQPAAKSMPKQLAKKTQSKKNPKK
jgi:hypothetical protein